MPKPTIAELEAILASPCPHNIIIAPDGSIHVGVNMGDVTGIHLNVFSGKVTVALEIGKEWIEILAETYDGEGHISHIVEPAGVQQRLDAHRAAAKHDS